MQEKTEPTQESWGMKDLQDHQNLQDHQDLPEKPESMSQAFNDVITKLRIQVVILSIKPISLFTSTNVL